MRRIPFHSVSKHRRECDETKARNFSRTFFNLLHDLMLVREQLQIYGNKK